MDLFVSITVHRQIELINKQHTMSESIAPGKPFPDDDYHGHPNYIKVYIALLVLFGISLVVGFFTSPMIAVILIFVTAIIKTAFAVANFMHLKFEPLLIWIAVGLVAFILLAFFWGVFPDISIIKFEQLSR